MTQEEQWRLDLWGYRKALGHSLERMAGLMRRTASELQEIEQGDSPVTEAHARRARTLWVDHLEMEDGGWTSNHWGSSKERVAAEGG